MLHIESMITVWWFFLAGVDTDDGFAVYEVAFCFEGFRVDNVLLNIFGLVKLPTVGRQKLLLKVERQKFKLT